MGGKVGYGEAWQLGYCSQQWHPDEEAQDADTESANLLSTPPPPTHTPPLNITASSLVTATAAVVPTLLQLFYE